MIAAAGARVPAVEHELFSGQTRLARFFVERRRLLGEGDGSEPEGEQCRKPELNYRNLKPTRHDFSPLSGEMPPLYSRGTAMSTGTRGGSIAEWVVTDGYEWGMGQLAPWMADLMAAARKLESPALATYLEGRDRALFATWEKLRTEMEPLRRLAQSLR